MFVFCSGLFVPLASEKIMSESTGSRSRLVMSEMFVFCSGLLVSLTFGVSCQRSRLSEIRWLNVKQPTSTRLSLERERTRSQVKLVMSVSNWLWLNPDFDFDTGPSSISISMLARLDPRECCLGLVTYRSDPRVSCWLGLASWLSDRNCENFRLKHSTRGLRAQSSSVRRIRLHTLNHDV